MKMKNISQILISHPINKIVQFPVLGLRRHLDKLNKKFSGLGNAKRKLIGGLAQFVKIEINPHRKDINVPIDLLERHNQQRLVIVRATQN